MNDFTASNGWAIEVNRSDSGRLAVVNKGGTLESLPTPEAVSALREFFQAEADERLGRWRWPADPDFVVYEPREGQPARVLRESTAQALDYSRLEPSSSTPSAFRSAAQDYFDAHPEPKPWHDAQPGEVWELTLEGKEPAAFYPSKSLPGHFTPVMPSSGTTALDFEWPLITAGRRIWPEVS